MLHGKLLVKLNHFTLIRDKLSNLLIPEADSSNIRNYGKDALIFLTQLSVMSKNNEAFKKQFLTEEDYSVSIAYFLFFS